jgi:acetyl-CoA carboxylase carboxyltransferase component
MSAKRKAPEKDVPAKPVHTMEDRIAELRKLKAKAGEGETREATQRQHDRGKLTARERCEVLLDEGSFQEFDMLAVNRARGFGMEKRRVHGDGVVTGWGTIDGRKVFIFSQDFTFIGGTLGEVYAEKICKVMDLAASTGAPVIGINDGGGARVQEGMISLAGYAYIFDRNVRYSGVIPQISIVAGPCAGGAVYSPAITDFIFMVKGISNMQITGPDVIKTVTGEDVTLEELGGAMSHATKSGVANFVAEDEEDCYAQVRHLLSYLPSNNLEEPPYLETGDPANRTDPDPGEVLPDTSNQPYDMHDVITRVVDRETFYEYFPHYAPNIITGFARLGGHAIGVIANQPRILAGALNVSASEKAARFIRTCDAFNVPIVTFMDVPGFQPGTDQEWGGIIRRGAKLLYAFTEATVPRLTVVTRKAYGGAYVVMNSKHIRADICFAWPTAEFAVMGADAAVPIIQRRDIEAAEDPVAKRAELVAEYEERFLNPWIAAERGYIDDVIEPAQTRPMLIRHLEMLRTKRESLPQRKHGNIPL